MNQLKRIVAYILVAFLAMSCEQQKQRIDFLTTFAKAYGYVKYFHPSDEASVIDWNQFAAYGADEINKCKNKEDLIKTLNSLFKPIAPTVNFLDSNSIACFNFGQIQPEDCDNYCITFWQHKGVGLGMSENHYSPYESKRVKVKCNAATSILFEYSPGTEEIISKYIGSGVYCQIPIALYKNGEGTFPNADKNKFNALKRDVHLSNKDPKTLSVRLGNIINTFNVFQHFYPYFDVVQVNWEEELRKMLVRSYQDRNGKDHLITLQKFTALLQDGHIFVNSIYNELYSPHITWEWIEDQLVITNVFNPDINLEPGDVVTHINGVISGTHFAEVKSRISAATIGWLYYQAEILSLLGPQNSSFNVLVDGKTRELLRDVNYYKKQHLFKSNKKAYEQLMDSIYYLNLDILSMQNINELIPEMENSKAIICDLRGYPNNSHEFIRHLLNLDDTTKAWTRIPLKVYPDQEKVVGYDKYDWTEMMTAKQPYLGDKRIIFIIDGRAISYAESILGFIDGYNLATIIGQPSAGTNGNVNIFKLLGGYSIGFTAMKVLKHDDSRLHGIGFLPDVYVLKTIQGVKEGRDEFFEKAIEIAKSKN